MTRAEAFRLAPFGLGALIVAGIVHIVAILLVPHLAGRNAAARLAAGAEVNALAVLPPVMAATDPLPLPFADPAQVMAHCPFDLEDGPVRLRVPTGDAPLSVVVLAPSGRVLLALTDRAAIRRVLNVVLATPEQMRQIESQDPDDEPVQELRIRMGQMRGVAVVRALALRDAEKRPLAASLARATCRQE
jgi:uncharacterized membrane protein